MQAQRPHSFGKSGQGSKAPKNPVRSGAQNGSNAKSKSSTPTPSSSGGGQSLKSIENKKRTLFKPILNNPYTNKYQWPMIQPEIQTHIVELLVSEIIPELNNALVISKEKGNGNNNDQDGTLSSITWDFNTINELLENQASQSNSNKSSIKYLFVCKPDIKPFLLIQHFPMLCALSHVKLIQLPQGTSTKLSSKLLTDGLITKPVEMLCVSSEFDSKVLDTLISQNVADVDIGFLSSGQFNPTDIKFLKTLQPIVNKKGKK